LAQTFFKNKSRHLSACQRTPTAGDRCELARVRLHDISWCSKNGTKQRDVRLSIYKLILTFHSQMEHPGSQRCLEACCDTFHCVEWRVINAELLCYAISTVQFTLHWYRIVSVDYIHPDSFFPGAIAFARLAQF